MFGNVMLTVRFCSDNRYGIISGFSSHLPIILDIVLTLCVGIAMTTVEWWSGEGYTLSVSFFFKAQKSSNIAGGCQYCCVLFVRLDITRDSRNLHNLLSQVSFQSVIWRFNEMLLLNEVWRAKSRGWDLGRGQYYQLTGLEEHFNQLWHLYERVFYLW